MIKGVEVKKLKQHSDSRGWFCENIRVNDGFFEKFGQWSDSLMYTGVIKAWHIHSIQTDYWRVPIGVIRAVLCDMREDSPTHLQVSEHLMGAGQEPIILKIPPGVAHGCKVLQGPALLSYVTTETYNPDDEGRIAYDDNTISYDWLTEVIK
jgi:dTDP-4-dehydrorhamnose 3,5-epimerase